MRGPLGVRWVYVHRSHTGAVSRGESLKASTQQRGPNKSGASLVRHR